MNRDQVEGKWRQVRGRVKETWGSMTGDGRERFAGKCDRMMGRIQERYGRGKQRVGRRVERLRHSLSSR